MNLRPNTLQELVGQNTVKEQLKISLEACKINKGVFSHTLVSGAYGLGKTTVAQIIASELNQPIEIINGANLRQIKSLLPCLSRITSGSILFCDEVHKASPLVQTYLLTVIEKFQYTLGKDENSITLELPEFCFVGATTNIGPLLPPLVNRFTYHYKLESYSPKDLAQIILLNAQKIGLNICPKSAIIIALTCRGTPRTAQNRLKWIHDYITAQNIRTINPSTIIESLKVGGIGLDGLEQDDKMYLDKLELLQPAGINTMASATNIDRETLEKTVEPFLIQKGFIKKTQKGRVLCNAT